MKKLITAVITLVLAWVPFSGTVVFAQGRQSNRDIADKIDQIAQDAFVARAQVEALRRDVTDLQGQLMKLLTTMYLDLKQNRATDQPTALWRFDPVSGQWCVLAVAGSLSEEANAKLRWCQAK